MSAQVVVFNYDSGSTPGRERIVYFADGVENPGIDMEDGSFKRFTKRYMRNYRGADGGVLIEVSKLPTSFGANALAAGYRTDGKLVYHDTKNNVVVVANKLKVKPTMQFEDSGKSFVVEGNGRLLRVRKHSFSSRVLVNDQFATPETLLAELQKVVNG